MCARDATGEVRDGGDQCWPHFGRRVSVGPVITARMEAQGGHVVQGTNAAIAQIRLCNRAGNPLRHREQPSCGFWRSDLGRWLPPAAIRPRFGSWQAEEGSRLVEYIVQTLQPAVQGDEVEEITVLAGSSVSPFAGSALPAVGPCEANEQAAARRVRNIADDLVATPAMALREVMAAHRLGITRETARQIGGLRRHFAHAAALSPVLPACGIAFRSSWARHSESSRAACCAASPLSNMAVPSKSEANQ